MEGLHRCRTYVKIINCLNNILLKYRVSDGIISRKGEGLSAGFKRTDRAAFRFGLRYVYPLRTVILGALGIKKVEEKTKDGGGVRHCVIIVHTAGSEVRKPLGGGRACLLLSSLHGMTHAKVSDKTWT